MKKLSIHPVTRDNWEKALQIKIHEEQVPFVPSIYEALTYAYIKPWDEALDPFLNNHKGRCPIKLESPRLLIRDLRREDWLDVHAYASNPEVTNRHEAGRAYEGAFMEQRGVS